MLFINQSSFLTINNLVNIIIIKRHYVFFCLRNMYYTNTRIIQPIHTEQSFKQSVMSVYLFQSLCSINWINFPNLFKHELFYLFQDFVQNLSILSRGSLDEKLRWAFTLYDINGDGCITREEMTDIVSAIYDLMGKVSEPSVDEDTVKEKVDRIFQVTSTA